MKHAIARILARLGRPLFAVLQVAWDAALTWVEAANQRRYEAAQAAATREERR